MEERTYVEERSFRKLQKQGGSLVVSLPKKWIKEVFQKYLDDKEEALPLVAIDILNDRSLKITPGSTQSEDIKKELILESNPYVVKELVNSILSGETYIVIRSDKVINKSLRNQIRYWVNGLPNTEITEESNQRIVVQNFGFKTIPTEKLIKRLLYIIADMFDDLNQESYENVNNKFDELRKFYFILVMHIRTYLRTGVNITDDSTFSPLKAMDYRIFCGKVEEIGKILKRLKLSPPIMPFFEEIHQYYSEVMDAYLKRNSKLSYYVWLKKYPLIEKANELLATLDINDHDKIKDMIGIAERCKDMAGLI
jgi:phosphate uptake regulator